MREQHQREQLRHLVQHVPGALRRNRGHLRRHPLRFHLPERVTRLQRQLRRQQQHLFVRHQLLDLPRARRHGGHLQWHQLWHRVRDRLPPVRQHLHEQRAQHQLRQQLQPLHHARQRHQRELRLTGVPADLRRGLPRLRSHLR